jgi:hypothetical protein
MKENIDGNLHLNHSLYDVIDEILDEIENIPYHSINEMIVDCILKSNSLIEDEPVLQHD